MKNLMNRNLIDTFFPESFWSMRKWLSPDFKNRPDAAVVPAVDVIEGESKYTMNFDLPGVQKADLKIECT